MQVSTWKDTVTYKQTITLPASLYTIQSAPLSNRIINHYSTHSKNSRHITHDRYAYSSACAVSVEGLFSLAVKTGSSWMELAQQGTARNLRNVNDHTRRLTSNHGDHCRLTATSSPAVYTTTNHQFHTSNGFVDPEKRTLNG